MVQRVAVQHLSPLLCRLSEPLPNKKFKKILLYILVYVVALAVGGVLAAIGEKITALGFLSTAMDWGFDTIHLNLKVINLALALQFHISVGQIIMIVVCIFTAPKIVGKLTS